jgi:hypothetical protein
MWPLFSSADDHVAVRPIYSQYMKHGQNEYNEFNVLWPIVQFDTHDADNRIFPIFWGDDYFTVFPVFWNTDDIVAVPPLIVDKDGDGIFEVPFSGNEMEAPVPVGERQRNWWDNFAFGHKDIYFNCLCHRALRELSELLEQLGRADEAEKYRRQLAEFEKNFYSTYYNPATGVLAGWISADGRMHDYMFTFAVSMAIDEGLIPKEQGKEMLLILLKKMEEQGYGDLRYGIPGNVLPVADPDTIHWPCMSDWGRYENGGLCGMNGFHFLTAMYKVGLTEEADAIFKAILHTYDTQFTHTGLMPGYVQSVDWRTKEGNRCGYNYLADNYYFLLAAYTGKAGIDHPAVVK